MKSVALGLVATFSAAMVGCNDTKTSEKTTDPVSSEGTDTGASTDDATGGELKGEEVDLNVMVWDRGNAAPNTTTEENALTKWIQEQMKENFNINVSYTSVPRSESDDKVNIMMSGGSAPDIVFTYDQNLFYNFASNGALTDLTELYNKYGQNIEEYGKEAQTVGTVGDQRFAVMKQRGTHDPRHVSYIRKDWLDELGMELPKTKEELGKFFEAAKEKKLGGEKTIPWAMSGRSDTEKMYLNFLGSYVDLKTDKDAYMYSEAYMAVHPEAKEGLKQLNQWYNDGLITQNFPVDTTEDTYKADVANGHVGFVLDDTYAPWASIEVLNNELGHETFVPIQAFDLPDGSYRTPHEYRHAMFVMVPASKDEAKAEAKAEAAMKYLNWLAHPDNAMNVRFTPDHTFNELGVALEPSEEEKNAKGYPGTCDDLCIMNLNFSWANDIDIMTKTNVETQTSEWATLDWYKDFFEVRSIGKFMYPVFADVSEAEATYGADIKTRMLEFVYKTICAPADQFEATYESGYAELENAGLKKIIDARSEFFDTLEK